MKKAKEEICKNCKYYDESRCLCRRYPPIGKTPLTGAGSWCGEFKTDEVFLDKLLRKEIKRLKSIK